MEKLVRETSQPGALGKSLSCGPFKRQAGLNKHTHKPCPVPCGEKWVLCQEKDSPEEDHKARKESVPIIFSLSRTGQVSFSISQSQALSKARTTDYEPGTAGEDSGVCGCVGEG